MLRSCLAPLALAGTALCVLSASAHAQAQLVRSGGVLGGPLGHSLFAPMPAPGVLFFSLEDGPIPLALIDPTDPRVLDVGLDFFLAGIYSVVLVQPAGTNVAFPLPADPSLSGFQIRAQFVTVGTGSGFFGDISNRTRTVLAAAGERHLAVNERAAAIDGHTGTLLDDGRVLLAGGSDLGAGGAIVGTLEIYDPQTMSFELLTGSLQVPRAAHTATKLSDGRVLIVGGTNAAGQVTQAVEIFDPASGSTSLVGGMNRPRVTHSATLLPDGRLFVAGGLSFVNPSDQFATLGSTEDTTEIFDPNTASWTFGPTLPKRLSGHGAALGNDGRVLIAGGLEVDFIFGLPFPTVTAAARRFDPASGAFVPAAALPSPRVFHVLAAEDDGRIVSVGGANLVGLGYQILNLVQRYDPAGNTWSSLPSLARARAYPNLVRSDSGWVVIGGINNINTTTSEGTPEASIEVTGPGLGAWTVAGDLLKTRLNAISVAVDGGLRVLTTGVGAGPGPDQTGELFIP
jgi:hypothetical protein